MIKIRSDLVRLTTQDVSKALPVTDSLIIATLTEREHRIILQLAKKYRKELEDFGQVTSEMRLNEFKKRSQEIEVILLNEGQATFLITLMRNTPKVLEFKKNLVKQFIFMKNELQARKETRYISVQVRKSLTDSIKENVNDEGNFKKFAYSNYSKLAYKIVLGMKVKKFKEKLNLSEKDNVRDFLTVEQLKQVQDIESKIATRIEVLKELDLTDKETYQKIKEIL